jgi:citronellol/citronellal dehydrogenase
MSYQSIFRSDLFAKETILITGGGSGIGRCIAHELSSLGANVIITGRSIEKLEKVASEIVEDGGTVDIQAFDIRDEKTVEQCVAQILTRNGPITALVNNAGGQFPAALEDISQNGWEAVVRTNLTGGFLMSREVFKQCMKGQGGNIVNITADNWHSMPRMAHTGAARAGMVNLTKTASVEWACFGVRVNAVAPGLIASSGMDTYDEQTSAQQRKRPSKIPLKRIGVEAEVSAAVVFLLSPAAAFITGETLRVDGGAPNMDHSFEVPDHNHSKAFGGFHRATLPDSWRDSEYVSKNNKD